MLWGERRGNLKSDVQGKGIRQWFEKREGTLVDISGKGVLGRGNCAWNFKKASVVEQSQ